MHILLPVWQCTGTLHLPYFNCHSCLHSSLMPRTMIKDDVHYDDDDDNDNDDDDYIVDQNIR